MFLTIIGTIIGIFMAAIGIGWLWDMLAQWRLSRQRPFPQPYWFIQWKWTIIQIYQKLTRRRYKQ